MMACWCTSAVVETSDCFYCMVAGHSCPARQDIEYKKLQSFPNQQRYSGGCHACIMQIWLQRADPRCLVLQMDEVLKELGPKENPNKDSSMRLIPPAKVVGEGAPPPSCTPPLGYRVGHNGCRHCCNLQQCLMLAGAVRSVGFREAHIVCAPQAYMCFMMMARMCAC